jgi:hypothetical protein
VREMNLYLRIDIGPIEHSSNLALNCILPVVFSPNTGSTLSNIAVIPSTPAISHPNITVKLSTQGIGFIGKSWLAKMTFLATYL